jgi:hypothetical protein
MRKGLIERLMVADPEPGDRVAITMAYGSNIPSNAGGPEPGIDRQTMKVQAGMRGIDAELTMRVPSSLANRLGQAPIERPEPGRSAREFIVPTSYVMA